MKSVCEPGAFTLTLQEIITCEEFKAELREFLSNATAPVPEATTIFHSPEDDFFGAVVLAVYWFARGFREEDFWSADSRHAVTTGCWKDYNLYAGDSYLRHRSESEERHMVWHRGHLDYPGWYDQLPELFKHFVNAGTPGDTSEGQEYREAFVDVAVTPNEDMYQGHVIRMPLWINLLTYLGER